MKKTLAKGFTLIELLVVIAIIGILASVILASLNTARAKGADAAAKADFSSAQSQAEIFYDGNTPNSYQSVCDVAVTTPPGGITTMMADAAAKAGVTYSSVDATSGTGIVACHDSPGAWAASVPLKSVTGYFCVDSTGKIGQTANALAGGAYACS